MVRSAIFAKSNDIDSCLIMIKRFLAAVCAMVICVGGYAQERKHAIEITTGYPNILLQFEFPWLGGLQEYNDQGQDIREYFQPVLNVGYTYSWAKRWEVSGMVHAHGTIFDVMQYPLIKPAEGYSKAEYDFNGTPTLHHTEWRIGLGVAAAVRYKWLAREAVSMYSSIGLGWVVGFPIPLPYIAPVGIKFGKGRVYGMAEINMTPFTSFGMVGLGVRL